VRDDARRASRAKGACDQGDATACRELGDLYADLARLGLNGDPVHALAIDAYRRACSGGDGHACTLAGKLEERNAGVPWLERGCLAGDPRGCWSLGEHYDAEVGGPSAVAGARALALQFFQRGCALHDPPSCDFARIVGDDRSTPTSALRHAERACDLGSADACHSVTETLFGPAEIVSNVSR
jgi:uncharacterized protein